VDNRESLAVIYMNMLAEGDNIPITLAKFYWELFSVEPKKDDIIAMSKLVRVYGRDIVYSALLDMYDVPDIKLENIYPLLVYMCKKRLLSIRDSKPNLDTDLSKFAEELHKSFSKKKRKLKVIDPFNE
jgi:hypothetical protein